MVDSIKKESGNSAQVSGDGNLNSRPTPQRETAKQKAVLKQKGKPRKMPFEH